MQHNLFVQHNLDDFATSHCHNVGLLAWLAAGYVSSDKSVIRTGVECVPGRCVLSLRQTTFIGPFICSARHCQLTGRSTQIGDAHVCGCDGTVAEISFLEVSYSSKADIVISPLTARAQEVLLRGHLPELEFAAYEQPEMREALDIATANYRHAGLSVCKKINPIVHVRGATFRRRCWFEIIHGTSLHSSTRLVTHSPNSNLFGTTVSTASFRASPIV